MFRLLLLVALLAPFPAPPPTACGTADGQPWYRMTWTDDGTLRGLYRYTTCEDIVKALPGPDAPPQFVWTGENTGVALFWGPGVLEKRALNGHIKRVFEGEAAALYVVEIPASAPADLADRPFPGDVFCVGNLCSAPVQPRGTRYLPLLLNG